MAPLPDVPGVVRCGFTWSDNVSTFGSRIYVKQLTGGQSVADLEELATGLSAAWEARLNQTTASAYALVQVECTDLTTITGNTGFWTGDIAGILPGDELPSNTSVDLQLKIAPRYRGGHPVMHLPPPDTGRLQSPREWSVAYQGSVNTEGASFLSDVNAISIGADGDVVWVVLRGYRPGALPEAVEVDVVQRTACRAYVGTMRRRARALR